VNLIRAFDDSPTLVSLTRLQAGGGVGVDIYVDVNERFINTLGYSREQLLGHTPTELGIWEATERAAVLEQVRQLKVLDNAPVTLRAADGSLHPALLNAELITLDGTQYLLALLRDVGSVEATDIVRREAAEQALQLSEEKYRTLVDHSQDGVFITHDGNYTYVNKTYADMLGYAPEQMIGAAFLKFFAPEDHEKINEIWNKRRAGQWEQAAYEIHLLKSDGITRVLASVRSGPIMLNGTLSSTGTIRDITDERRTQQALFQAEQSFRNIFENAVVGMYQSTPDGHFIKANQALAGILGYESPDDLIRNLPDIRMVYADPSERGQVLSGIEQQGQVRNAEVRMRRRDGSPIWVSMSARVVRNNANSVAHFEGSIYDITAQKTAEQALQRSEQRYRLLVDHSQVGVFINENGRYTYVNNAFAAMLGYTETEFTQLSYRDIFPPEELAAADERFEKRLRGEAVPDDYESSLLHKDRKTRVIVTQSIGIIELEDRRVMIGTVRDITDQKRFEAQLHHNANHDPLTGLPNRTLFIQRLSQAMEQGRHRRTPSYAVLFVDLDSFKVVNDSLGHAVGDQLLIEVAKRLKQCVGPWDTIARHGGDEFTILVDQMEQPRDAVEVAERIQAELLHPIQLGGNEIYTNSSIGIAPGNPQYLTTDEVLRDADTAMYQAKAAGKAGYVIFDQSMYDRARARLQLETELRQALDNGEFRVYYQPIVAVANQRIAGFEALVRWQHPRRGLLLPEEFLHVAEETGLILPIGWWVLHKACRQAHAWRQRYPEAKALTMSVNLAHKQFMHTSLAEQIASALRETLLEPSALHLEITETIFLENPRIAETRLQQIKKLGAHLHLDDFGTGYSSLSYLSALPLDTLKIDRVFIADAHLNHKHAAMVRTIIELARDLQMETVAEGVENEEQLKLLRQLECRYAQGFLFAPALESRAAEQLLSGEQVQEA
jgi:diguanylate cyclase (GGDEF)-like protein/PAS domain S-box-containing protein